MSESCIISKRNVGSKSVDGTFWGDTVLGGGLGVIVTGIIEGGEIVSIDDTRLVSLDLTISGKVVVVCPFSNSFGMIVIVLEVDLVSLGLSRILTNLGLFPRFIVFMLCKGLFLFLGFILIRDGGEEGSAEEGDVDAVVVSRNKVVFVASFSISGSACSFMCSRFSRAANNAETIQAGFVSTKQELRL